MEIRAHRSLELQGRVLLTQTIQSVYRTLEGDSKNRMWFVFDNCLVLPEYLVEFDYITNFECKRS